MTNEERAKKWVDEILKTTLQEWVVSKHGTVDDIEQAETETSITIGRTVKWKQSNEPAAIDFDVSTPTDGQPVEFTYTVRLEVTKEGIVGTIEFTENGTTKSKSEESDITDWSKEKIREDIMDKMCR